MASYNIRPQSEKNRKAKKVAFAEAALFMDKEWVDGSSSRTEIPSSSKSDCDLESSSALSRNQPNILKKREYPLPEPIKSLPFSPSRFLNPVTTSQDVDKVTKDLNFSTTHADDSGFDTSTCDADGLFAKALTSTPICKKSRRPLSTPLKASDDILSPLKADILLSDTCMSLLPESETNHCRQIATSGDSGNETVFKTPLIRRFLNESGPRTPTPFKCETTTAESNFECHSDLEPAFSMSILDEDNIYAVSSICDVRSSGHKMKSRCDQTRSQKKARKALVLDMEMSPSIPQHNKPNSSHQASSSQLAVKVPGTKVEHLGFVPFDHPLHRNQIRIRNCSGLVDDRTVVQCRKFGLGRKSFCTTHQDLEEEENKDWKGIMKLNKKWIAVACGHSEDQKTMTNAARSYLRASKPKGLNNQSDLSNAVLRKRFERSSMMR